MGSLLGIADTKGAIYDELPADGVAVINADDAFAPLFAQMAGAVASCASAWSRRRRRAATAASASRQPLPPVHAAGRGLVRCRCRAATT
jgi:UDP-N-acetylmuramyl pentapeptide synthase